MSKRGHGGGKTYLCESCLNHCHHTDLWKSNNYEAFPPVRHDDGSLTERYVCAQCEAHADVKQSDDEEKKMLWETDWGRDGCGNSQPTLGGSLPGAAKYVIKASCKAP